MAIHLLTSTTRLLLAATLLAGLAACSDGAGSPTQPSDVTGDIAADADTPPVDTITAGLSDTIGTADLGLPVGTVLGLVDSPYNTSTFPLGDLRSVLPADAIPALTDPVMVRRDRVDYLADSDLILGVVIDGEDRAYPLNIGWWHEIVNDTVAGHAVSVTFCPLTGTGLVFDAQQPAGAVWSWAFPACSTTPTW